MTQNTQRARELAEKMCGPNYDPILVQVAQAFLARHVRRPIWLRREGDHAVVLVEKDGVWTEVIREHVEGPFSHIWEDQP